MVYANTFHLKRKLMVYANNVFIKKKTSEKLEVELVDVVDLKFFLLLFFTPKKI